MGDNVVESQAREILAQFRGEFEDRIKRLEADKARMESQIRDLESALSEERKARERTDQSCASLRYFVCELHAEAHPVTPEEIQRWQKGDFADYPYTIEDILADVASRRK